ncbi:nucleotidyltransferase domain-containing protein [bacterium]|nr:nucleotidyltransferase domain-containing protein [bacterium]
MVKFDEVKLTQLCHDLNLSLVALFGSQATGKTRVGSDIDIAVLSGRRTISPEYKFEVWEAFLWFFHRADVDVIILNHAPSLLGYKVATTGQVLYEARANVWRDFRLLAIKKHADAKKFYELQKEYIHRTVRKILND